MEGGIPRGLLPAGYRCAKGCEFIKDGKVDVVLYGQHKRGHPVVPALVEDLATDVVVGRVVGDAAEDFCLSLSLSSLVIGGMKN